jgi:hypothetical protein
MGARNSTIDCSHFHGFEFVIFFIPNLLSDLEKGLLPRMQTVLMFLSIFFLRKIDICYFVTFDMFVVLLIQDHWRVIGVEHLRGKIERRHRLVLLRAIENHGVEQSLEYVRYSLTCGASKQVVKTIELQMRCITTLVINDLYLVAIR